MPAFVPEQALSRHDVLLLLPSAFLTVLLVSVVSAATSGGGRELLPREQAVAFPVSTTTDHLGALLMAPLNIAWLLQCWVALGATSYAIGERSGLALALVTVLAWLLAATAVAQTIAWCVEWVRRGRHGRWVVRAGAVALAAVIGTLIATGNMTALLDRSPTVRIVVGVVAGSDSRWWPWAVPTISLLVLAALAVVVGGWVAGRVVRRPARDELRAEASRRAVQGQPSLGPGRADAHGPGQHLALGAHAPRHGRARAAARDGCRRRFLPVGGARHLPRPRRLRRSPPGFFVTTKLDVSKADAGVQQILTDSTNGYGAKNVKDVKCNNGQNPTVKKGASFDCDVSIDGTKRSGDCDVPGQQGHLRGGPAQVGKVDDAGAARRAPSAAATIDDPTPNRVASSAVRAGSAATSGRASVAVENATGASVATATTGPATSM